jgi:hypothetical protein
MLIRFVGYYIYIFPRQIVEKIAFFFFFNHLNFVSRFLLFIFNVLLLGGEKKKTEKPIKLRKPEKNNRKNRTVKKNRLKFLKNRPVWFRFYKPETEKTESNPNRKNRKNRIEPEKNQVKPKKPSQPSLNRFFFLK